MNTVYLLLGSNIGERKNHLSQAIKLIEKNIGKIILQSSVYNTAPWGNKKQNDFLNQAICVETKLSAENLLSAILAIEKKLGRERPVGSAWSDKKKWEARIIDIDIVFFNHEIIKSSNLQIPHPHFQERKFALVPLVEIAKDLIHPILQKSLKQLLRECKDRLGVIKTAPKSNLGY